MADVAVLLCSPAPGAEREDVGACGPGVPVGGHALDAVGVLGGEVVGFGTVGVEVVEFPGLVLLRDQLPAAVADGAVALVFPDEGTGALEGFASKGGTEAGAFHGLDGFATECAGGKWLRRGRCRWP